MKQAARYDRPETMKDEAVAILDDMERMYSDLGVGEVKLSVIRLQKEKLKKGGSYAERVRKAYGTDFTRLGLACAEQFTKE